MEEHRLSLVVERVPGRDRRRAEVLRDTAEERVARVARLFLALRRALGAADADRRADVVGDARDERGIRGRGTRARAMVEVRDVEHEAELVAQLCCDEAERGRVGAAGDGEHERTGTED